MTLGDYLCSYTRDSKSFQDCYEVLLQKYVGGFLGCRHEDRSVNLESALRYTDILSKSSRDEDKVLAQEMALMLFRLYPYLENVKNTCRSVMSVAMNLRGLEILDLPLFEESILDGAIKRMQRDDLVVPVAGAVEHFTPAQRHVFDMMRFEKVLSYSGPTSFGKTFLMRKLISFNFFNGIHCNYGMVIPTKALINEVSQTVSELISECVELMKSRSEKTEVPDYAVITSPTDAALTRKGCCFICVMTPERMVDLLESHPLNLGIVFIDEAHKLSAKNEDRSPLYYHMAQLINDSSADPRFIFSSPNIPNPEIYARILAGRFGGTPFSTTYSPVSQFRSFVNLEDRNAFAFDRVRDDFFEIGKIDSSLDRYDLISNLSETSGSLVYCNSLERTMKYALEYALRYSSVPEGAADSLEALAKQIEEEINPRCYLARLVRNGVAYHVSYLPHRIRKGVEDLFRERKIRVLFCTSTLIEGVNLPADNLFILSKMNGTRNLYPVELSNLMGRAGRIGKSVYGNVVFLSDKQDTLKIKDLNWRVPRQSIGVEGYLEWEDHGNKIISSLLEGSMRFSNLMPTRRREALRYAMLLIDGLCTGKNRRVVEAFSKYASEEEFAQIKALYEKKEVSFTDGCTLAISDSQMEGLRNAILAEKLEFSDLSSMDEETGKTAVQRFLCTMSICMDWSYYEKDSIGRNEESYKYFGAILYHWMKGDPVSIMVQTAISFRERYPEKGVYFKNTKKFDQYERSNEEHINYVIADTLNTIENHVQFTLGNYLQCYSNLYKEVNDGKSPSYDWSEFVSFGTMDSTIIELQKLGFSRESARGIVAEKSEYLVTGLSGYMVGLMSSILDCEDETMAKEAEIVYINNPGCFLFPQEPESDEWRG